MSRALGPWNIEHSVSIGFNLALTGRHQIWILALYTYLRSNVDVLPFVCEDRVHLVMWLRSRCTQRHGQSVSEVEWGVILGGEGVAGSKVRTSSKSAASRMERWKERLGGSGGSNV
jgi:hypothetical protein